MDSNYLKLIRLAEKYETDAEHEWDHVIAGRYRLKAEVIREAAELIKERLLKVKYAQGRGDWKYCLGQGRPKRIQFV